jgi:pSer/pThr/pTyr-binding forkhead associated (FHA) protein
MSDKENKEEKAQSPQPDIGTADRSAKPKPAGEPETIQNMLRTTKAVLLSPADVEEHPEKKPVLPPDTVAIHLPGRQEPLVFQGKNDISMGRSHIGDTQLPDVDFITDRGGLLGVSRRHSIIRQSGEGHIIEDLNSTNGTWVNGTPLVPKQHFPLQNGDQVQLGQLILFVYFSYSGSDDVDKFCLVDERQSTVTPQDGIAPQFLTDTIIPYLQTIIKIQTILDAAQGIPSEVSIQNIGLHKDRRQIEIGIKGVSRSVNTVRDKILPLRGKFRQYSDAPESASANPADKKLPVQGLADGASQEQTNINLALATKIIASVADSLADDKQSKLIGELLPHIGHIIKSGLTVIV